MAGKASILVIGNEILSGKVSDGNGPFLIEQLRGLGVEVHRLEIVPDEVPVIAESAARLSASSDWVFSSGGVGPTLDDVTFEGLAAAFEERLLESPRLAEVIRAFYGEALREAHLRMARVPEGAEILEQPGLAWPIVTVRNIYVLPGFPEILRRKFLAMKERFRQRPFFLRRLVTQLDEGDLAPFLLAIEDGHPDVALGSYPSYGESGVEVLVTLEGREAARVEAALEALCAMVGHTRILHLF